MSIDRKAAINAYKQRKIIAGVFCVSCAATGEKWVGSAADLSTIRNRIWFALNLGRSAWPSLQAAWKDHGADAFSFSEVERLGDDLLGYDRQTALEERAARWRHTLGATAI